MGFLMVAGGAVAVTCLVFGVLGPIWLWLLGHGPDRVPQPASDSDRLANWLVGLTLLAFWSMFCVVLWNIGD